METQLPAFTFSKVCRHSKHTEDWWIVLDFTTRKRGIVKLCSCFCSAGDKCVKKKGESLHSLLLSWAISYWMANGLLYCNTLNNIHKCLNPFLGTWMCLWAWTITETFVVFFHLFLQLNYLRASPSVAETPMCQALIFTAELFQWSLHPHGQF